MPNYDYRCIICGTTIERNVAIPDRDSQRCEKCKNPLVRLLTFQGSVWSPTRNGGHS